MVAKNRDNKRGNKNNNQVDDDVSLPVNKVVSKGVVIEFTRKLHEAESAYKEAAKPKQWWSVLQDGSATPVMHAL